MSRIEARDKVFKFVFEDLFHGPSDSVSFEEFVKDSDMNAPDTEYVRDTYTGIIEKKDEILSKISSNTKGYSLDRIYRVDLAILMVATYELLYSDLDEKIIVNEAVKLCKKYSTAKSSAFCNGVLASIIKDK